MCTCSCGRRRTSGSSHTCTKRTGSCCRRSRSQIASTPLFWVTIISDRRVGLHDPAVRRCRCGGDHNAADSRQSSLHTRTVQSPTVRKFFRKPGLRSKETTGPKWAGNCHMVLYTINFNECNGKISSLSWRSDRCFTRTSEVRLGKRIQ